MAGRPRKPTHLKLVTGTAQPSRMNPAEPKPRKARPTPPEHLSDRAKTAWGYVSALLERMGVLTEADGLALEGLCECYADRQECRKALRERGSRAYETESVSGSVMHRAYPEVAMIADADRRFRMWLAAFGLSPADRSRVKSDGAQETDPLADLIG